MSGRVKAAAILLFLTVIISLYMLLNLDLNTSRQQSADTKNNQADQGDIKQYTPPENLSLPFNLTDVSQRQGLVSPFGVVTGKANKQTGNTGIEMPLLPGSAIKAVASGYIISVDPLEDEVGGYRIVQSLETQSSDEGWVFVYDHLDPLFKVKPGETVKRGEVIAQKNLPAYYSAAFRLAYAINNHRDFVSFVCWIDHLGSEDEFELDSFWQNYVEASEMRSQWRAYTASGSSPFRELVDGEEYNDELKLCYPPATDVR